MTDFVFQVAKARDAVSLAGLHNDVADHLTKQHGRGPWSSRTSEKGVLYGMRVSRIFVVREGTELVATLRLTMKKPWAINAAYFSPCRKPLYLLAMAVTPARQRQGIGRWCMAQAINAARDWPAEFLRLDAYDAEAGAGPFYERCGFEQRGKATYRNAPLIYYELELA